MTKTEDLRQFVSERLTAAAEEIFRVFEETIAEYERELQRQRTLLDIVSQPRVTLPRIDQHVCKEEEELPSDQQLSDQDRVSSVDQDRVSSVDQDRVSSVDQDRVVDHEEPEPPQIKEEQEEFYSSLEGEHFAPQQINDAFNLNLTWGHSEIFPVVLTEVERDPPDTTEKTPSKANSNTHACDVCGKVFSYKSKLITHVRIHTGEKPHSCSICGKTFAQTSNLNRHMITHTGEKPYVCGTCGKRFALSSHLNVHMKIHTGEKPYSCNTCGKRCITSSDMNRHIRTHVQ